MNAKNPLSIIWLINAALLAAVAVWWASLFTSQWQPPAPLIPDYSAALDGALLPGQLSAKDYSAITERPLFEIDRTWPQPAPKAKEQPPEPKAPPKNALDDVVLQGIYDQAGSGIAIFSAQGKSHRLKMGETFEDWTLDAIEPLSASFSHPMHGEKVLKLKRGLSPEELAAAAQASAAARASNASSLGVNRLAPRQNTPPARTAAPAPVTPPVTGAPRPRSSGGASIGGSSRQSVPSN